MNSAHSHLLSRDGGASLLSPGRLEYANQNGEPSELSSITTTTTTSLSLTDTNQDMNNSQRDNLTRKKIFKTEYKSNFTPFDQYVYDKSTDTFIKHPGSETKTQISASNSYQDLASQHQESQQQAAGGNTQEVRVFEPTNTACVDQSNGAEPWYKEVQKRNEKANEYRFKSEIGHNSPFLSYSSNGTDSRMLTSSSNNDLASEQMETKSHHSDQQLSTDPVDSSQKQQSLRFTPNDYKRDNLISQMANNNNFNLPKEHQEHSSSNSQTGSNRPKTTAHSSKVSAPPRSALTRSAVQTRARSQCGRQQPEAKSSNVKVSEGKSNISQNSPVKTPRAPLMNSRATLKAQSITPVTSKPKTTLKSTDPSRSAGAPSRSINASSSNASQKTPTAIKRQVPPRTATPRVSSTHATASKSTVKTTTPSTISSTLKPGVPSASRATPTSAPRTANPSSRLIGRATTPTTPSPATTARSQPSGRPATTVTKTTPKTSTRPLLATSRPTTAADSTPSSATLSSSIKSIKTPKAGGQQPTDSTVTNTTPLVDNIVNETIAAVTDSAQQLTLDEKDSNQITNKSSADKSEPIVSNDDRSVEPIFNSTQPMFNQYVAEDKNKLIFTSTEAGNMLADELAQAEMASKRNSQGGDAHLVDLTSQFVEPAKENEVTTFKLNDRTSSKEGAETSFKVDETNLFEKPSSQGQQPTATAEEGDAKIVTSESGEVNPYIQQYQNYEDEPYSIMPITSDQISQDLIDTQCSSTKEEDGIDAFKDEECVMDIHSRPVRAAAQDLLENVSENQVDPDPLDILERSSSREDNGELDADFSNEVEEKTADNSGEPNIIDDKEESVSALVTPLTDDSSISAKGKVHNTSCDQASVSSDSSGRVDYEEEPAHIASELLMDVSNLMGEESKPISDMSQLAESIPEALSPQPVVAPDELILSPHQLADISSENVVEMEGDPSSIDGPADSETQKADDSEPGIPESEREQPAPMSPIKLETEDDLKESDGSSIRDVVTNSRNSEQDIDLLAHSRDSISDSISESSKSEMKEDNSECHDVIGQDDNVHVTTTSLRLDNGPSDEIGTHEHWQRSNHLTNSDDELILEPRINSQSQEVGGAESAAKEQEETTGIAEVTTFDSSRLNEDAGLNLVGQDDDDDHNCAASNLVEGSSATIESPTMAENLVEMATSKCMTLEHKSPHGVVDLKFSHDLNEDSDSDNEEDLNMEVDSIKKDPTFNMQNLMQKPSFSKE